MGLYVFYACVYLVIPTMVFHRSMLRERDKALATISARFNAVVNLTDLTPEDRTSQMEALNSERNFTRQNYPVWPFPKLHWRLLSLATVVTSGLGFSSSLLQFIQLSSQKGPS